MNKCYNVVGDNMKKYIFNDREYELIKDYKDGFDFNETVSKFTDYFEPYDYILGDWSYGKLRLKGFCEKENNNFNNLILDIRMQHAARLITTTEKHINSISDEVGYVSTSYFIRNFKSYFGITPKQFSLKVKRKS